MLIVNLIQYADFLLFSGNNIKFRTDTFIDACPNIPNHIPRISLKIWFIYEHFFITYAWMIYLVIFVKQ